MQIFSSATKLKIIAQFPKPFPHKLEKKIKNNVMRRLAPNGPMETGNFTLVGNWWDRKGENEIDMIALNEFDHTGIAAEIKRNPRKISLTSLQDKVNALPHQSFGDYTLSLRGLSIDDM